MLKLDLLWVCKGDFDPEAFQVGEKASPKTRLLNAYVDFDEKRQKWYIGWDIDEYRLNVLIRNVEQVVLAL